MKETFHEEGIEKKKEKHCNSLEHNLYHNLSINKRESVSSDLAEDYFSSLNLFIFFLLPLGSTC